MTIKEATANSLLMFVAATCVVLIVRAVSPGPQPQGSEGAPAAAAPRDGVTVYYMHSNTRCPTCRTIEEYAHEAVESGFGDELKRGTVRWEVVNYETPGNEHYAKEYDVVAPTVVLVKMANGKQVAWKGLPEVWEHVGDKAAFVEFVQKNLRALLDGDETTTVEAEAAVPLPEAPAEDPLPIPK